MAFYVALDFVMWGVPKIGGGAKWRSSGVVAVTDMYSVELQIRPLHPWLAEYDQRLEIYARGRRNLESQERVDLGVNTGGLTHVLLYAGSLGGRPAALLVDRFGNNIIDLETSSVSNGSANPQSWTFLGTFDGGAPQFVPAYVQPESSARIDNGRPIPW